MRRETDVDAHDERFSVLPGLSLPCLKKLLPPRVCGIKEYRFYIRRATEEISI
jgi:hypothetical protein